MGPARAVVIAPIAENRKDHPECGPSIAHTLSLPLSAH